MTTSNNKCVQEMYYTYARAGGAQSTHTNLHLFYSSTKTSQLTCYRGLCVRGSYMKDYSIQVCGASLACIFGLAPFCKNLR